VELVRSRVTNVKFYDKLYLDFKITIKIDSFVSEHSRSYVHSSNEARQTLKINRGYYSLSEFTQIPPGYLSLEETLAKFEISGGLCIHAGAHKLQEL
jgi:hypothetical protein